MTNSTVEYSKRIEKTIDYIDENLDGDLSVETLSAVANFSKFHFHRQFRAYTGINVAKLILIKRLKRASYQLATKPEESIIDIALNAQFENAESFSRAFKRVFDQSPSEFKNKPFNKNWLKVTSMVFSKGENTMQVNIVDFKECKVAALEHRGPIEKKLDSIVKFIEWRKINGYPPTKSATYNIFYQNSPDATPEEFHFDVCCAVDKNVAENPQNVTNKIIPGGRCAVLRHLGSSNNLEDSMEYLYRQWLPTSGEELRHFPVFVHRVKLESEESENDAITDIYLPLNNLTIT